MLLSEYKVAVPEGEDGTWRVEHFQVSRQDALGESLRAMFSSSSAGRGVPEGAYTRLMRGRTIVMSDTPDEIRDHMGPIIQSRYEGGNVLLNGLGLGMVAAGILRLKNVEHVTIVEQAPEVIRLVGPTLVEHFGDRVSIIEGDALTWKPPKGARYSVVWHDIWDNICGDNLSEMKTLHRRYGRRSKWQRSWCRWQCERRR